MISLLRRIKIGLLAGANASGLSRLVGDSAWRRRRFLILCYHGVSDGDLHQWNPSLFMNADRFRKRLNLLRDAKCNVLNLKDALRRVEEGSLPERSVVLTFDDGFSDFCHVAWPILQEFGYPATLYLTTYYMVRNLPVFDLALDYLLWKGRGQRLDWPEVAASPVSLNSGSSREMRQAIQNYAAKKQLGAAQKNALLEDLAGRLGLDYDALRQSRALSLINQDEARKLSSEGADLQLHTHRHRTSAYRDRFLQEIVDNRECLSALGLPRPEHFCYPSGLRRPNDPRWLEELGIKSAATSEVGYVAPGSDRHLLPRVMDCSPFTETEFLSWIHGTAALLPHRASSEKASAILEEPETELLSYSGAGSS